jgi:hypothetical protein
MHCSFSTGRSLSQFLPPTAQRNSIGIMPGHVDRAEDSQGIKGPHFRAFRQAILRCFSRS